jgi:allantoin racemase
MMTPFQLGRPCLTDRDVLYSKGGRTVKLRIVTPITTHGFANIDAFGPLIRPDTELSHVEIDHGPGSIECAFDEALAAPDTIAKIIEAERDGVDGVIINCMGDPGMHGAREAVAIPVIGPGEATMHIASMLGHQFSVLTVLSTLRPQYEHQAKIYGVFDKLASVRSVDIPVLELEADRAHMVSALIDQAILAIEEDGADVLIFGCTGMLGAAEQVQAGLEARGYGGVPVIDSMVAAIKLTEALVDMGLRHSKRTYPYPPAKRIVGYDLSPRTRMALVGD